MVASLTSRVLAEPSGCLPRRPSTSAGRTGTPGTVQPQVHGRRGAGDGFGHIAFVGGDLTSQGFGGALDLLGLDAHRGQFPQQAAGRGEAEVGRRQPHHPQHAGRQRRGVQAQRPVARTDACAAGVAVVVGAFQCQRPQHRGERLGPAAGVARRLSAGARCRRTRMVGMVLVQSPCHRRGGDSEGLATECLDAAWWGCSRQRESRDGHRYARGCCPRSSRRPR